jgi:hypothetical protein
MCKITDDEKRMYLMFHGWHMEENLPRRGELWGNDERNLFYYLLKNAYLVVRLENGYTD